MQKSLLFLGFLFALSGCTKTEQAPKKIELAIWSEYLSQETIDEFEKTTGYKISLSHYASNEELLAKLQAGASGYDVALPSDYMVKIMVELGLLLEVNRAQIHNFKKINDGVLHLPFDPENRFSVPYAWGTTGIAVRRDLFKGELKGWKDLFTNPALKGKFGLLDDGREVIGAALKVNSHSLNTESEKELEEAKTLLLKVKKDVLAFSSEPMASLENGDLVAAQIYSVDAFQVKAKLKEKLDYILPIEGGTFWIDHFVIPKGGKNPEGAHALINFLTDPKRVAALVQRRFAGPIFDESRAFFPKDFTLPEALLLSKIPRPKFELMKDLKAQTRLYDRLWTEIKTSQ